MVRLFLLAAVFIAKSVDLEHNRVRVEAMFPVEVVLEPITAETTAKGEVLTGVFYLDTSKPSFLDLLNLTEQPLATLPEKSVRPPREALDQVMEELR